MNSFSKKPLEQYPVIWEFAGLMPPTSRLASGTVSALDLADNTDQTGNVLVSPTAAISGTKATVTVRGGVNGKMYRLRMQVALNPDGTITDDILMSVGE